MVDSMDNLYLKYYNLYQLAIDDTIPNEDGTKKDQNPFIIKDFVWITMKYLEDNNSSPFDENFDLLIKQLTDAKEKKMLEAIEKTLNLFREGEVQW